MTTGTKYNFAKQQLGRDGPKVPQLGFGLMVSLHGDLFLLLFNKFAIGSIRLLCRRSLSTRRFETPRLRSRQWLYFLGHQ
jgi:hypothetical protein